MTLDTTISLGQLISIGVVLVLALWGGAWALLVINARQYSRRVDEKFNETQKRVTDKAEETQAVMTSVKNLIEANKVASDAQMTNLANQTRQVERDLMQLKADLPNNYERRDDAIRRELTLISKLDRLGEKLADALQEKR